MKKIIFILVFIATYSNAIGQVDKIFIDKNNIYQTSRVHVHFLNLHATGSKTQDTLNIRIEVTNTGKYGYHPVAWHMVDSFLYAIEIIKLDELFVQANLIRYTIPIVKKNYEIIDIEQIKKTRKSFNYVQILDLYLFHISERGKNIERPMYFDFIIDKEGLITIAILEIDEKNISLFSKTITRHEKEESDKIPTYKRRYTWEKIGAFSATIQSPFRILKEKEKYYVVDSDGTLFEAKEKNLEKVANKKTDPLVLFFDKKNQESVKYLMAKKFAKENKINASNLKKQLMPLIDK